MCIGRMRHFGVDVEGWTGDFKMDTLVLIPAELYLAPLGESVAVFSRGCIKKGAKFLPCQGTVRLETVELGESLPEHDVRHRLGSLDVVQELDEGRHVRQCNWVRFLTFASTALESDDVNLVAALVDHQPVFRVVRDIPARALLVARWPEAAILAQEVPLDLSTTLWPPPPKASNISVATPSRRLCHRAVLPCGVCGKTFDRPSLLKRHMRTHTGEKPHVCEVCSKGFSTSSSLNTHRRIHSGEKPHECQTCGKRFTASSNLYYHRMTHTKEKPHKCSECGKSFPTPGDLKAHTYIHSGSWPYRCPVCNRGFSKQTNLRNHAFLHTGDRPHPCEICGKKFALVCNLRAHNKTHHQDPSATTPLHGGAHTQGRHQNNPGRTPSYANLKLQTSEDETTPPRFQATTDRSNFKTSHKIFPKSLNETKESTKQSELVKVANASFKNTGVNNVSPHVTDFSRLLNYSDFFFGLSLPLSNNSLSFEDLWLKNNVVNSVASNVQSQYNCLPTPGGSNHIHPPYMASLSLVDLQAMLFMQADVASILKHNEHLNMSYN